MRGFKKGSKPKAARTIESGPIKGAGTGTSDDINANVAEGSYVMPADSTEQIGDDALGQLGKQPINVNLSNGEHLLDPQQVHAVGVQTLNQIKDATHVPAAQQRLTEQGKPELFFANGGAVQKTPDAPNPSILGTGAAAGAAQKIVNRQAQLKAAAKAAGFANGGPVFSGIDPDELGRGNNPARNAIPRSAPIYVDSQGAATRALPSQSRALVPAGPVTGTSIVPAGQSAQGSAQQAGRQKADFYSNARGETNRGFGTSSSRAVVPAGPVTGTSLVPAGQQAAPTSASNSARAPRAEPDYRARAEAKARAARDTAAFNAERDAQDKRFNDARNAQPSAPQAASNTRRQQANKVGKVGGFVAAPMALLDSAHKDSTARYAERFGMSEPTGDGSFADIAKFTALRGLGFASDLGNNLTLGTAGPLLFRDMQEKPASNAAPVSVTAPASVPSTTAAPTEPASPSQADSEQSGDIQSNGYQRTGIDGVVGRKDGNGQYSFTNESGSVAGASGDLDMPRRGGTFSTMGDGREAMDRNLRAAEIMQGTRQSQSRGFQPGGVTVVKDSSREDALKRSAIKAATTPYRNSPGGQLTANQLNALSGMSEASDRNSNDLAREQMNQDGANLRTAITEAGTDRRHAQTHALDQQAASADIASKGFAVRSGERLERLYEQYDKAKPEDRGALAEQIRVLSGKEQPARFGVAAGGQVVDPVTQQLVTQPAVVYNQQTGEVVSTNAQAPAKANRPAGTRSVVNGKTAVWNGTEWIPE